MKELASLLFLFQEKFYYVKTELDLRDSQRKVVGKRNLLLKSFFNLIKNAIEDILDKGKIRIEHYYENGWIHIKVSDTGVGVAEDKFKILGTPFFSTKIEGTGLGLTQELQRYMNMEGISLFKVWLEKELSFIFNCPLNNKLTTFY